MNERRRLLLSLLAAESNSKFTITFQGIPYEYEFEEGMTWKQFVNSPYNINNLFTIVTVGFNKRICFQDYDVKEREARFGPYVTENSLIDSNLMYFAV